MTSPTNSSDQAGSAVSSVLVVGAGRIGSLVAKTLRARGIETVNVDMQPPAGSDARALDVTDADALGRAVAEHDAVVACLPYDLNATVAVAAHAAGRHYIDPTEDVATTATVSRLSEDAKATMIPQSGFAPGLLNIVAASLVDRFDRVDSLKMRAGALPRYPTNALGYSFTWSPDGVINECLEPCQALSGGALISVPPLTDLERIVIDGTDLEAFSTSGGTGTLCDTYAGRIDTLNYKSIRYPGHRDLVRFFLNELGMGADRENARDILAAAYPQVFDDVLYLSVTATGTGPHGPRTEQFVRAYRPRDYLGERELAVRWCTVAGICGVVELLRDGALPERGLVRQEDIPYEAYRASESGLLLFKPTS